MQRRRGHIVCVSSMSAFHPMPGATIYSSTKFAARGFIEALSEEIRQEGFGDCIHFSSVHPYFVSTRKDLMSALNLRWIILKVKWKYRNIFFNSINRFPAITADETADITVDGLLKNKLTIVAPKMDRFFVGMIQCLPEKIKHLVRDYILFERQSKMFKMPIKSTWKTFNCTVSAF